jgi:hypothetical protein
MSGEPLTLKHFVSLRGEALVEHLGERVSDAGRNLAIAALDEALDAALGIPLAGLLARSWSQADELRQALADAEAEAVIPLLEHTIATTHTPSLELYFGRKRLAQLPLQIELNLVLAGVALELKGGRIAGLSAGECSGQGAVTVGGVSVLEQSTPAIPLPGRLAFAH